MTRHFNRTLIAFTLEHADSVSHNWLHTAFVWLHRKDNGSKDARRKRAVDQLIRIPQAGRGNRQGAHGDPGAFAGAREVVGVSAPAIEGAQPRVHETGGVQHVGGEGFGAALPTGVAP